MTNFEKIKKMSVDEMSRVICNLLFATNDDFNPCTLCRYYDDCDIDKLAFSSVACLIAVHKWLESEAENNV